MLCGDAAFSSNYAAKEKASLEKTLAVQLAKFDIPHKNEPYLMERMLTMYANPVVNYLNATR